MFHRLNVVEEHPTYEEAVEIFLNTVRTCYHGLVSSAGHLWFPDEKNGEKMVVEVEEAKQGQQQQGQQQQGQQQQGQSLSSPEQKKWLHDMIYVHIPQKLEEVETSLLVGSSSPPVSSMYRSKSYPSMSASKKSNPIIELDVVSSDANKSVTAVVGDAPPSLPPPTIFIIICCDMVVVEEGAEVEMDVDVEMGSDPVVLDDQRVG